MYDYVTREFDLTPEEQEKARALNNLESRYQSLSQEQAFRDFREQFYSEIWLRLAQPGELRGGWNISEDGTKLVVCQVKWIGDSPLPAEGVSDPPVDQSEHRDGSVVAATADRFLTTVR